MLSCLAIIPSLTLFFPVQATVLGSNFVLSCQKTVLLNFDPFLSWQLPLPLTSSFLTCTNLYASDLYTAEMILSFLATGSYMPLTLSFPVLATVLDSNFVLSCQENVLLNFDPFLSWQLTLPLNSSFLPCTNLYASDFILSFWQLFYMSLALSFLSCHLTYVPLTISFRVLATVLESNFPLSYQETTLLNFYPSCHCNLPMPMTLSFPVLATHLHASELILSYPGSYPECL